jgi:hypothetical protein
METEKGEVKEWMRRAAKRIDDAVLRFETREQEANPVLFVAQIIAAHCPVEQPLEITADSSSKTIMPGQKERAEFDGYANAILGEEVNERN